MPPVHDRSVGVGPIGRAAVEPGGFVRDHPHRFDAGLAVLIFLATVGALLSAHRMGWTIHATALDVRHQRDRLRRTDVPPHPPVAGAGGHGRRVSGGAVVQPRRPAADPGGRHRAGDDHAGRSALGGDHRGRRDHRDGADRSAPSGTPSTGRIRGRWRSRRSARWRSRWPTPSATAGPTSPPSRSGPGGPRSPGRQEARRRVGDERLRIARELHDVLAHHIAVINVQAGVAGHLLERQPRAGQGGAGSCPGGGPLGAVGDAGRGDGAARTG